ncbi:MAG: hypothetical protein L6Q57_03385 [Alphaproteobacteria bacterium]|nr:hypothetical protein [Alphaproteobacteria bacterium]
MADRIVDLALRRLSQRQDKTKPVVLLMGENHSIPEHFCLQMLVIKRLKERGKRIACGIEDSCDQVERVFSVYHPKLPVPKFQDPDGEIALKASSLLNMTSAPLSHYARIVFLAQESIPIRYNSLAKPLNNGIALNLDNQRNKKAFQSVGADLGANFAINSDLCLETKAANNLMSEIGRGFITETPDLDVYIQICGRAHVLGDTKQGIPYDGSLSDLYKKDGYEVLAFCSTIHGKAKDFDSTPLKAEENVIGVKLQGPSFLREHDPGANREKGHIKHLFRECELGLNLEDVEQTILRWRMEIISFFAQLADQSSPKMLHP